MDEQLRFAVNLVAAFSIALAGGWLAARVRLSPIFGYVAAGMIISPATPGFVGDFDRLRLLADVGVVLLLFAIGIQFSLRDLLRSQLVTLLALVQVALTLLIGYGAGKALGWGSLEALFFGAAVAQSSSTVAAKLISERAEEETEHARTTMSWSVFQDLSTVVLVVLLTVAADAEVDARELTLTGLGIVAFVAGVLVLGFRIVPWALEQVAAVRSREVFLLAIASLALGTAAAASAVGMSLALGAFLAGLMVSESDRSHQVLGEILPLRDVFAVLFFVAIGMLIDPGELAGGAHIFAIALGLIIVAKFALSAGPLVLLGRPVRTAVLSGALLAQSAEFTFIILDEGVNADVVSERTFSLTLTALAASIFVVPGMVGAARGAPMRRLRQPEIEGAPAEDLSMANHVVVYGYRAAGYAVDLLRARGFQVVVVDEDRRLVRQLRQEGITAIVGSGSNEAVLRRLDLPRARLYIVAEPDPILSELAVRKAREIAPSLAVVAHAGGLEQRARLMNAGVREAVVAEEEVSLELARHALVRMGVSGQEVAAVIQRLRLRTQGTRLEE